MADNNVEVSVLNLNKTSISYGLDFQNSNLVGVLSVSTNLAGKTTIGLNIAGNDNGQNLASYDAEIDNDSAIEYFAENMHLIELINDHSSSEHVNAFLEAIMQIFRQKENMMTDSMKPKFNNYKW